MKAEEASIEMHHVKIDTSPHKAPLAGPSRSHMTADEHTDVMATIHPSFLIDTRAVFERVDLSSRKFERRKSVADPRSWAPGQRRQVALWFWQFWILFTAPLGMLLYPVKVIWQLLKLATSVCSPNRSAMHMSRAVLTSVVAITISTAGYAYMQSFKLCGFDHCATERPLYHFGLIAARFGGRLALCAYIVGVLIALKPTVDYLERHKMLHSLTMLPWRWLHVMCFALYVSCAAVHTAGHIVRQNGKWRDDDSYEMYENMTGGLLWLVLLVMFLPFIFHRPPALAKTFGKSLFRWTHVVGFHMTSFLIMAHGYAVTPVIFSTLYEFLRFYGRIRYQNIYYMPLDPSMENILLVVHSNAPVPESPGGYVQLSFRDLGAVPFASFTLFKLDEHVFGVIMYGGQFTMALRRYLKFLQSSTRYELKRGKKRLEIIEKTGGKFILLESDVIPNFRITGFHNSFNYSAANATHVFILCGKHGVTVANNIIKYLSGRRGEWHFTLAVLSRSADFRDHLLFSCDDIDAVDTEEDIKHIPRVIQLKLPEGDRQGAFDQFMTERRGGWAEELTYFAIGTVSDELLTSYCKSVGVAEDQYHSEDFSL